MTLQRFRQIRNLYEAALEKDATERTAFLAEARQGDEDLGRAVERLLIAHERAADFIDGPLLAPVEFNEDTLELPRMEGRRVGAYLILREIGRGGMGTVYLASRADDVVHKQVAIKIVRTGVEADVLRRFRQELGFVPSKLTLLESVEADVLRRFRQERNILAALDHPAIARFIDGGSTEEGLPYFVMEYVEGEPIDAWCDRRKLNVTERLKLFRAVCDGVQYAHQRLVVHRDLKPANILVTADGGVKLLDFGIAKLLDTEGTPKDLTNTITLTHAMTPEYASPEQVLGEPIHTASDIYALGVVLYELLTGHRPYRMRSRILHEVARVICEEAPTRPSAVIAEEDGKAAASPEAVSAVREGDPARLRHRLEGDLDNILLKALEKAASRRYSSADQFSEDLGRHLEGLPVSAREDTLWYRAGKFIRRHQVGLAATVLIVVAIVVGFFTTLWQTRMALEALAKQVPNAAQPSPNGLLTPELVQAAFFLWIGFSVAVYFARANLARVLAALAGGVVFMLLFMLEESLPMGFHHFTWTVTTPPVLIYTSIIPYGAMIALLGWRLTRWLGWKGLLAFLAAAAIGGPIRDYMYVGTLLAPATAVVPGFLPWIVDSAMWLTGISLGQAIMRLIAGPPGSDRLARLPWKV